MKKMTEARKELVDSINEARSDWQGNALFGWLYTGRDGSYRSSGYQFGACHAGVMGIEQPQRSFVTHIISAIRRKEGAYEATKATDEDAKTWLDFIMNRSPWAHLFNLKGVKTRWREGWVSLKTNAPGNILQGALISTRMTWEYGSCCRTFAILKKAGVDEHTAFLMSFYVHVNREGVCQLQSQQSDHTCLAGEEMRMDGAKAFYEHKPLYEAVMYKDGRGMNDSRGVHKAYRGDGNNIRSVVRDLITQVQREGQETVVARATNPFAKAKAPEPQGRQAVKFTLAQAVRLCELFKEEVHKDG